MADDRVRFHLSLNVHNLERSVNFYRTLFGMEPAKVRADYAKFEPDDPPLVLSLEPTPRAVGGPLNHVGFRMPDSKSLVAIQERLERAGLKTQREEGVECCYAKQTKFWAHDPDGTLWEVYTFEGDLDHRGLGQAEEVVLGKPERQAPSVASGPVLWEHRMHEPFPDRLAHTDESVDEIRLRGTFNMPLDAEARRTVIEESLRALKPNGRLFVHVLVGEEPVNGPQLPGPAGAVKFVPYESTILRELEQAGLGDIRMLKFDNKPCFVRDGVAMRECQLEGWKLADDAELTAEVIYKGPFAKIVDDSGAEFQRGERVRVSPATAARLRRGPFADAFVQFDAVKSKADVSCG